MKRTLTILLALLLLFSLAACGEKAPTWQEQYDLGQKYLTEGNYEEAILAFTAAIEIDPKRPEAYLSLADAYLGSGDYDKALELLRQAAENIPDSQDLAEKLDKLENGWSEEGQTREGCRYVKERDGRGWPLRTTYYNLDGSLSQVDEYGDCNGFWRPVQSKKYDDSVSTIRYTYDDQGRDARADWYAEDGTHSCYYLYIYDDDKLTKRERRDPDGNLVLYGLEEYDADGSWAGESWFEPDGTPFD